MSFGKLGSLGAGFGQLGGLGGASGPPSPGGTAPVLSITSAASNNTPTFSVVFDDLVPAGSVLTLQHDTASTFATATTATHTVTSGEGGASTVPFGLTALPNGLRYFRLKATIGGVDTAWSNTVSITIAAASTLSAPTGTATGATTATLTAATDQGNGTLYWVATTAATAPTATQIKTGKDHTGATAGGSGSQAVSASGTQTVNATGLPVGTTLYAHFMQENNLSLQSNVVNSTSFLTSSNASYTHRATLTDPPSNSSSTVTYSVNIGTASADRVVVVALSNHGAPTSVTVNGVSLTAGPENTAIEVAMFYGVVASGSGAVNVICTGTGGGFHDRDITVWTMVGLQSNTPRQTNNNGNINTGLLTIATVATDFLFFMTSNSGAATYASSSVAPTASRGNVVSNTADWSIASTNSSFSIIPGNGFGGMVAITFR